VTFEDFPGFLTGQVCGPNTSHVQGKTHRKSKRATSRYYRSKQAGAYGQDILSCGLTLLWTWACGGLDGPLYEKNGNLTNFYPGKYSYNVAGDTIDNIGW